MNGTKVLANETVADNTNGPNESTLLGYMMATATSSLSGQSTPYLTQVFSSSNHFVFLFKVNYATETVIRVSPIHGPITYGEKVLIAGNLTDTSGNPLGVPLSVDVEYSVNASGPWNKVETIPVSQDGSFNYTWTPNGGKYFVRVHFLGTQAVYIESTSEPQALDVEKANLAITLAASTTAPAVGQNVTFFWRMNPFVEDANLTLSYTTDNRTFVKIKSFIATSPSMNYTWKVTVSGTFRILITYGGNENYNPTSASVILKTS